VGTFRSGKKNGRAVELDQKRNRLCREREGEGRETAAVKTSQAALSLRPRKTVSAVSKRRGATLSRKGEREEENGLFGERSRTSFRDLLGLIGNATPCEKRGRRQKSV